MEELKRKLKVSEDIRHTEKEILIKEIEKNEILRSEIASLKERVKELEMTIDEPINVSLDKLEVIPTEDQLPTIEQFVGSDPDFTGDMTTGEFIRSIRNSE